MSFENNQGIKANPKMNMSDEQKDFLLTHHEQMTNKQIAETLNVSETKIGNWLTELNIKKKRGFQIKEPCCAQTDFFKHDKRLSTI